MKKLLLVIVLGTLTSPLFSQVYLGASAGVIRSKLGGQFHVGWQFKQELFNKQWRAGIDITSLALHSPTWFGVQGGPVLILKDEDDVITSVTPYLGAYYKKVGNAHPDDKYVRQGNVVFLARALEIDQFNYGLGITVSRSIWYVKMGSFFNKRESAFALTIGIHYLFE